MDLKELTYNCTVQLASDAEFRGYVLGKALLDDPVLGVMIVVAIKAPGKTGKRGNVRFPLRDLAPAPVARLR